jgi:hypothetical protein
MKNTLGVIVAGLKDGWREPYDLSTSTNIDHLDLEAERFFDYIELLDKAINVGQLLRAGRNSQPWQEGWWPVENITKKNKKED